MNILRKLFAAFALMSSLVIAGTANAGTVTNISNGLTILGSGLAVHGYDVIAYFTKGEPAIGRAKFSATYNDATYRFASKAHLDTFEDDPKKFVPQYGGYCAYGVSVRAKFDGDPRLWKIVDGKLYLNLNEDIQRSWEKDIPGNIKRANRHWKRIATKTPQQLS